MPKQPAAKKEDDKNPFEGVDIKDPIVVRAATRIQAAFRSHKSRKELMEKSLPNFTQELKDMFGYEGSATSFFCRVWGIPDPVITWYKDGELIKEGPKYQIGFDSKDGTTLTIQNVSREDVGQYTCKANNSHGEAFDSARLIVDIPAKVTKPPENVAVKKGDTITMRVEIEGDPEADVIWKHKKKEINEGGRYSYEDTDTYSILRIQGATEEDAGKYEIEVENDMGKDRTFCAVSVK